MKSWLFLFLTCWTVSVSSARATDVPRISPAAAGMISSRLEKIDEVVSEGLARGRMPGCVVTVGRRSGIVFQRAYGHRQVEPSRAEMTTDTVFDLASLTKPIATATSIMTLIEDGHVDLDAPVARYLPEFGTNGKEAITIRHLLTHQGGLIPDNALGDYQDGPAKAFERINALSLRAEPGTEFIYTDVGFIVLAEVVRAVSGSDVHEYSQRRIFDRLGMEETGYLPEPALKQRAATTQQRDGTWMQGDVHDPRAWELGGIAGHAGLFSTADDLAIYATMMLHRGRRGDTVILQPETFTLMTTGIPSGTGLRALGWDVRTGYSSNRGDLFTPHAFGHGGFTGTAVWMDPELDLYVVFLSNRVHPDGKGSVNPLAGRIGTIAASAIAADVERPAARDVLNGVDVLQQLDCEQLQGRRVGLITNHTGLTKDGISTIRLLHEAPGVELITLFSPEHGIEGRLDIPEIADATEESTGLRIVSLYGENRTPTPESLRNIDTLVFDIQDIGTRFYTYISTMGNAMQAAAERDLRFVVLDRLNPIDGVHVEGPVLDDGRQSFVGFHTLPVRHGMTAGELAMMFQSEMSLDLDLQVIEVANWSREMLFDQTGMRWVNPSPNMRSLNQALLYPGIGLLETTNISVGRGTDTPFEVIGAPWMDGQKLAAYLNARQLPGVTFVPIRFTPDASRFRGEDCSGINILITHRTSFQPVRTGLEVAVALRHLFADAWETDALNRLLNHQETLEAIRSGADVASILTAWKPARDLFLVRRAQFLLY